MNVDPDPAGVAGRSFSYPSAQFVGDRAFVTYYESEEGRVSLVLRRFVVTHD